MRATQPRRKPRGFASSGASSPGNAQTDLDDGVHDINSNLFLTVYSSIFLQNRGLRNHRGGVAPGAVSPPGADGSTC